MAINIKIKKQTFEIFEKVENAENIDADFIKSIFPQLTAGKLGQLVSSGKLPMDQETARLMRILSQKENAKRKVPTTSKTLPHSQKFVHRGSKPTTISRTALINTIAEKVGITKSAARYVVMNITDETLKSLKETGKISIPGFGTFFVTHSPILKGRNSKSLAQSKVKAKKVAKPKPSKKFGKKM